MTSPSIPSPRPRIRPVAQKADTEHIQHVQDDDQVLPQASTAPRKRKREPNSGSFPPGVSGNPNGRPTDVERAKKAKNAKGAKAAARKILSSKIVVQTGRGPKKVSYFEALVSKEASMAAEGDWRARKTIYDLAKWAADEGAELPAHSDTASPEELTATGKAIIDWFADDVRARDQDEGEDV
jgi:hypothetical protein